MSPEGRAGRIYIFCAAHSERPPLLVKEYYPPQTPSPRSLTAPHLTRPSHLWIKAVIQLGIDKSRISSMLFFRSAYKRVVCLSALIMPASCSLRLTLPNPRCHSPYGAGIEELLHDLLYACLPIWLFSSLARPPEGPGLPASHPPTLICFFSV